MEWLPLWLLIIAGIFVYITKRNPDEVAEDIGQKLAKVSSAVSKGAAAYKEERKKYKETIDEIAEPINDIKKDIDSLVKGESDE